MAVMRCTLFLLALGFLTRAFAQNPVADWLPVHTGDKWIYAHETRDENGDGRAHLEIHHWQTEEIVTGSWTIPEGTLVARQLRITEGSIPEGWRMTGFRVHPNQVYLIRGDCLYGPDYGEAAWDSSTHSLLPTF